MTVDRGVGHQSPRTQEGQQGGQSVAFDIHPAITSNARAG
jgi:hypothetical protein